MKRDIIVLIGCFVFAYGVHRCNQFGHIHTKKESFQQIRTINEANQIIDSINILLRRGKIKPMRYKQIKQQQQFKVDSVINIGNPYTLSN